MPDGLSISPRVVSTRLPSRQHGDLRIEWDEKDHAEIIPKIQAYMDKGITFFVIEPPKGRRKEKVVAVTDLTKQGAERVLFVKDPDIKEFLQSDFARLVNVAGVSEIKMVRPATDAKDAAQNDTVGVKQGKGG